MGVLSQALAAEPPPPAPAAASSTEQQSATAAAGEPSAAKPASSSTPSAPAAKPDAGKPEITAQDHELMSRGYKLRMRNGEKWFCRREDEVGSHLQRPEQCSTEASILANEAASQEMVRKMQSYSPKVSN
jgi:hypothetical protein